MVRSRSPAEVAVDAALRTQAARTALVMIKLRARRYARRPMTLDTLYPGLSVAPSATMIAIAQHLLGEAQADPRRWFGFGGEVSALNARAVLLLGRTLRRAAAREDRGPLTRS